MICWCTLSCSFSKFRHRFVNNIVLSPFYKTKILSQFAGTGRYSFPAVPPGLISQKGIPTFCAYCHMLILFTTESLRLTYFSCEFLLALRSPFGPTLTVMLPPCHNSLSAVRRAYSLFLNGLLKFKLRYTAVSTILKQIFLKM